MHCSSAWQSQIVTSAASVSGHLYSVTTANCALQSVLRTMVPVQTAQAILPGVSHMGRYLLSVLNVLTPQNLLKFIHFGIFHIVLLSSFFISPFLSLSPFLFPPPSPLSLASLPFETTTYISQKTIVEEFL